MKKGIIVDIQDRYLTLLTPTGEFCNVKKDSQKYEIGQEMSGYPITTRKLFDLSSRLKLRPVLSIALSFIVLIAFFQPFSKSDEVYAYMTIDINPSLELGLNKDLDVVKIRPFNDSGKKLLEHIQWRNKDFTEVTQEIVDYLFSGGYLQASEAIIISTIRVEDEPIKDSDEKIEVGIKEIEERLSEAELSVVTINGTSQDREQAEKNGVTTGKFLLKEQGVKGMDEKSSSQKHTREAPEVNQNEEQHIQPGKRDKRSISKKEIQNGSNMNKDNKGREKGTVQEGMSKEKNGIDNRENDGRKKGSSNEKMNQKGNSANEHKDNISNHNPKEKKKQNRENKRKVQEDKGKEINSKNKRDKE